MFKEIAHSLSGLKNLMIHPHKQAEQILQMNRLYATLSRINHIIVRVSDRNELFQQICEACIEYGKFRMAWIGVLDEKQILHPVAHAGKGTDYLTKVNIIVQDDSRGRGPIGRSVREEKCIFCQDIATDPMMLPWRDEALKNGFRALASVPVRQHSAVIGTFSVYASEPMAFDDKQLQLIDEIGIDISFALDNFEKEKERRNAETELIKAKEKAEESDRLKTAFLQNMSHEIRTPMNAIMGFSNLLSDNFDNKAKLEKFAKIINQRCNDLLNIINDILDIAKIESGQVSVSFEECIINDLFEELDTFFSEYQERLGKQHIKLNLNCCCDPKKLVIYTDKVKLKQIFINLLTNALKFTDEGIIEGGCKYEKGNLWFFVSDTGIGIPSDKQEQIFERFVQLNPSVGKFTGGTGLGLPIVKGLINLLGGKIILHSEPGKGSTFLFTVSHEHVQHEKTSPPESLIYNCKELSDKTVLIVEDDEYNAEFIREVLSYTGVKILMAENGFKAIHLCETFPVDLILLDIQLPDMNGYEVHDQIQKIKPRLKTIIQTAYASPDEKMKAMGKGCTDYISKPMEKDALLSMLNKHLQE